MTKLSVEKVFCLLGRHDIPGSAKQLEKLCIRIHELLELNGEDWVKANRKKLLSEWEYIVKEKIMGE